MTGQELTALAMRHLGHTEPAQLARHLGLKAFSSPRRVKRWLDGEAKPNFDQTIALLQAVGMLKARPEATVTEAPAESPASSRLAALEAAVAQLPTQEDLERGLQTLRAAIDALANPGTGQADAQNP